MTDTTKTPVTYSSHANIILMATFQENLG